MKGIKMLMKLKRIKEKLPEEKMPPMLRHQHVNNNSDTNNKTKNQKPTTNNMMARIRISQIHPSQREQVRICDINSLVGYILIRPTSIHTNIVYSQWFLKCLDTPNKF